MTSFAHSILLIIPHLTLITSYTQLFEDLTQLPYFVDKTNMLRILFDQGFAPASGNPYYFISCPRYFGKTANLRMIQSFATFQYDENDRQLKYDKTEVYKLFKHLFISDYQDILSQHMSRYPVIYLDLKTVGYLANETQHVSNDLTALLLDCLYDHRQLLDLSRSNDTPADHTDLNESDFRLLKTVQQDNMTIDQVPDSLLQFCRLMYDFYNQSQVILLIDNYDDTAVHSFTRTGSKADLAYHMINSMLSRALDQGREYLKAALITGISSLSYVLSDSLRHLVTHYVFLDDHQFTPYFGLTHDELLRILSSAQYSDSQQEAIIDYFKGYRTFPGQTILYNPYSISNYFLYSEFNQTTPYPLRSYWANFETVGREEVFMKCSLIRNLITNGTIRYPLRKLHSRDALRQLEMIRDRDFSDITKCEEDILVTLYFETGYLSHTLEENIFSVPNKELREVLMKRTELSPYL